MKVSITASDCVDILGNQMYFFFLNDDSPIHTAGSVQSWFEEHEDAFQHIPCSAKFPDLYMIKLLGQF